MMNKFAVSILKAEHVKAVLEATSHRDKIPIVEKYLDMFLGARALISLQRESWSVHRKIISKAFHWQHLRSVVDAMNSIAVFATQQLLHKSDSTIEMYNISKCITLDVIGIVSCGIDFNCTKDMKPSAMADALEYLLSKLDRRRFDNALDPRSIFYWWPTEENRKYAIASSTIRNTISEIVSDRVNGISPSSVSKTNLGEKKTQADLLTHLLEARKQNPAEFDDSMLLFIYAGYDITSVLLTYLWYIMATHEEVEVEVLKEITSVLGIDGKRQPTYEQLCNQFPYCMSVLLKTLRLYPPVPLTSRNLTEPLTISIASPDATSDTKTREVMLPSGSMIYIPICWIHRDPSNFKDPLKFIPERILDPDDKASESLHRYCFIPFSGGARDCVGRRLVLLEAMSIFIHVVRKIRFEVVEGFQFESVLNDSKTEKFNASYCSSQVLCDYLYHDGLCV